MSVAAENVIGGILLGGRDVYWRVADLLSPQDFPTPWLANLYRVCSEVARSGADLDAITVADEVERQRIANPADVLAIVSATTSAANVRGWAERVKVSAIQRRVKAICAEGAKSGDLPSVQTQLAALLDAQPSLAIPVREGLNRMWDDLMVRYSANEDRSGLPTGVPRLDELTGGLQPGRVYGVGARAKMGKTMLAMGICAHVALAGNPVGIWSLEMSAEELLQRMTCAVGGVPSVVMQHPKLLDSMEGATDKIAVAIQQLQDAPLSICDRTDVSIDEIEAQARQLHATGKLSLLCIDYLALLRLPKADRHDLAIAYVTRRAKVIAKELRIPVLLVFQLNRGSETGAQVRPPRPSDARDSGAIEQDLDAMLLLHRPSYYDQNAAPGLRLELALQRNGPTGLIHMDDELHLCRFTGGHQPWVDGNRRGATWDNGL